MHYGKVVLALCSWLKSCSNLTEKKTFPAHISPPNQTNKRKEKINFKLIFEPIMKVWDGDFVNK